MKDPKVGDHVTGYLGNFPVGGRLAWIVTIESRDPAIKPRKIYQILTCVGLVELEAHQLT
jgi:hypothetical protein